MTELGRLAWPDLGVGQRILVVPTGSCEQHGPHLPLDTDTLIAASLAAHLATVRDDVVVSPPLAIGASGEHQSFPGTLSIGTEAMTSVVVELARSALPPPGSALPRPFSAVLCVNGHGGNLDALDTAVRLLRGEGRRVDAWHPRVEGGDPHAGRTETSLMLHLHPERVRMELAEPGSTARFSEIADVLAGDGLAAVTANGILGDPTDASAEHGEELFEGLCRELEAAATMLCAPEAPRGA
jgi:mycofactocin system creatininase family protein